MKKFSWAAAALLLMTLMVLGLGCSTDKGPGTGPDVGTVGIVMINMPTDTLTFLPGDSATCDGYVLVADGQGRALQNVKVSITLLEAVGVIELIDASRQDTTDQQGRVYFRYRTIRQTGHTTVRAAVGTKVDLWPLTVLPASQRVRHLFLTLSKSHMAVAPQFEDSVLVTVTITDSASMGVSGMVPPVRSDRGRMAPIGVTDNTGRASTWWYTNGEYGLFHIWVQIDTLLAEGWVQVDSLRSDRGSMVMSASLLTIRADRGLTSSELMVTLKDQYGSAIMGDTIKFSCDAAGTALRAWVITDSTGIARTNFTASVANPSITDSATVVARYTPLGLADTVRIHVAEASDLGQVTVVLSPEEGVAGVDTVHGEIRALYADGSQINGMRVEIFVSGGPVTPNDTVLVAGKADFTWKLPRRVPEAPERAKVWVVVKPSPSAVGMADTAYVDVLAGPPRKVHMTVSPPQILIGETANVWADVLDSLDNKVGLGAATIVFATTLGTVSPMMVSTNSSGRAECTFSPSTQAGNAIITARTLDSTATDTKMLRILANSANSIRLTTNNASPQVVGTGGNSQSMLSAEVFDANQNHVPDGQVVWFQILSQPGANSGCSINNHGIVDSAITAGGFATATFNAGWRPGPVEIRARTYTASVPVQELDATVNNINIVAGPPKHIQIQATNNHTDADPLDAAWTVPLIAMVTDTFANPVGDGVAVFFSLVSGAGDDTASIQSDTVYTGNGAGMQGLAYSALRYIAAATGEVVTIQAETGGANAVQATINYTLPLQDPTINLYCMPATWLFGVDGNRTAIECMSVVRDGFGVAINKVKVIYSTTRGRFFIDGNQTGSSVSWRRTGPDVENAYPPPNLPIYNPWDWEAGHTSLFICESAANIFGQSQAPEITGDVTVEVEGFPEAIDSQTLNYRR